MNSRTSTNAANSEKEDWPFDIQFDTQLGAPLEKHLRQPLLAVPTDFSQRVMASIANEPLPVFPAPSASIRLARQEKLKRTLQALGIAASTALGLIQLTGFMFGIWTSASLG